MAMTELFLKIVIISIAAGILAAVVLTVLHCRKPAAWIAGAAVAVCAAAAVCSLTEPAGAEPDFIAVMQEAHEAASPLTLEGYLSGSSSRDIYFIIDGVRYTVASAPTVSAPEYGLTADGDDGMERVTLRMHDAGDVRNAVLSMLSRDGSERIYLCDISAFERLLTWQNSGMPVDLSAAETQQQEDVSGLPYTIQITRPDLAIYAEPGYDNTDTGVLLDTGTYTITEEAADREGIRWGRLQSGAGWIDLDKAAAEAPRIPMTAEFAHEDTLSGIEYHEYMVVDSEYTQKLLFSAYETLTDVCFTVLQYEDGGFRSGRLLYAQPEMTADTPLVIGVVFYGDLTTYGISFTASDGEEYRYMIYLSGRNGALVMQTY